MAQRISPRTRTTITMPIRPSARVTGPASQNDATTVTVHDTLPPDVSDIGLVRAHGGTRVDCGQALAGAPFAGYWEYYLEEAQFVGPAHPHWSGAALIGPAGDLIGVGSLRMDQMSDGGEASQLNLFVPAELLTPILDDLTHDLAALVNPSVRG